jgi:hypothetical protein
MSFDLGDVGEFINDNPQIPIAAGLVAGQAIRRNAEQARKDAADLKKSLAAIHRQNDEAHRLALQQQAKEQKLADDRESLFRIAQSVASIMSNEASLLGYLQIRELARELASRNLTSADFADYQDKEMLVALQAKMDEGQRTLAASLVPEQHETLQEIARWDQLACYVREISECVNRTSRILGEELIMQRKIAELNTPPQLTIKERLTAPSVLSYLLTMGGIWLALCLVYFVFSGDGDKSVNPFFTIAMLGLPSLFFLPWAASEFFNLPGNILASRQGAANKVKLECESLSKERQQLEGKITDNELLIGILKEIDSSTLDYASSSLLTPEERASFLESCEDYMRGLLSNAGLSTAQLPIINRLYAA